MATKEKKATMGKKMSSHDGSTTMDIGGGVEKGRTTHRGQEKRQERTGRPEWVHGVKCG
jgi:hypothetical protein